MADCKQTALLWKECEKCGGSGESERVWGT